MASFGDFIKQERERNFWTQTDFGAKVGINSSAVSRIEHGTKQLSPNKLNVVAKLFNIDISKIKVLYFGEKIAREVYKNDCPESVFIVAEETVKYLKIKNVKQSKIKFD